MKIMHLNKLLHVNNLTSFFEIDAFAQFANNQNLQWKFKTNSLIFINPKGIMNEHAAEINTLIT